MYLSIRCCTDGIPSTGGPESEAGWLRERTRETANQLKLMQQILTSSADTKRLQRSAFALPGYDPAALFPFLCKSFRRAPFDRRMVFLFLCDGELE
jgi:hypothetical protein